MKVDDKFLARAIRVSFEVHSLVVGGLESASEAAEDLEKAVHGLWVESGRDDISTRDISLWAEAQGELMRI